MLRSDEMRKICADHAKRVQQQAGDGYMSDSVVAETRAYAFVKAETTDAWRDNLRNNTLVKALH